MMKRPPPGPRPTRRTGFATIGIGGATVMGALSRPPVPALIGDPLLYLLMGLIVSGVGVMIAMVEPR